jgi:hypothetical protein
MRSGLEVMVSSTPSTTSATATRAPSTPSGQAADALGAVPVAGAAGPFDCARPQPAMTTNAQNANRTKLMARSPVSSTSRWNRCTYGAELRPAASGARRTRRVRAHSARAAYTAATHRRGPCLAIGRSASVQEVADMLIVEVFSWLLLGLFLGAISMFLAAVDAPGHIVAWSHVALGAAGALLGGTVGRIMAAMRGMIGSYSILAFVLAGVVALLVLFLVSPEGHIQRTPPPARR